MIVTTTDREELLKSHDLLCHHMALGLQVVAEDYVHSEWVKIPAVVAARYACLALAVAGVVATVRAT